MFISSWNNSICETRFFRLDDNLCHLDFFKELLATYLAMEFRERNIPFREQVAVQISYKDKLLQQHYVPDFVVYDKIIVEIKAIRQLNPVEEAQLINYLKATKMALGLLINFGNRGKLKWQRRIISANIHE